jgi:hypothetical protein
VADQNFRPLDFYGKDWDMQRYYWSVSTAEAAAVVKFRTERIGEFGDEPVETTLSVFQSLTQAEALNYLPEDDMVMEVLWNDKVWHHVVLHILDKGGLDEARVSQKQ